MNSVPTGLMLLSLAILAACGTGDGDSASAIEAAPRQAASDAHPCDVFTTEQVSAMFEVGSESIAQRRDAVPGNIACSYKWAKPDQEEIAKRNQQAMMKAMTSGGEMPTFESDENSLLITFHGTQFGNTAEAIENFDRMVDRLTGGISAGTEDVTFDVQASFEAIDGIGARAAWSDELRQVSAVSGTLLYHVMLDTGGQRSSDRARAEEVARMIADAI